MWPYFQHSTTRSGYTSTGKSSIYVNLSCVISRSLQGLESYKALILTVLQSRKVNPVDNPPDKRDFDGSPFTLMAAAIAALTDTAAIFISGAPEVVGGPADPVEFLQSILAPENNNEKRQIFDDLSNPTLLFSDIIAAATDGLALKVLGGQPVAGGGSNLFNLLGIGNKNEKRQTLEDFSNPTLLLTDVIAAATDEPAIEVLGAQLVAGGASNLGMLLGTNNEKRQLLDDLNNPTLLFSDIIAAATDPLALNVLKGQPVAGGGSNLGNLLHSRDGQSSFLSLPNGLASRDTKRMLSRADQSTESFTEIPTPATHVISSTTGSKLVGNNPVDTQSFIKY
jgi:hypothetical protein